MSYDLFCRIQYAVEVHDPYFIQRRDGLKKLDFSSLHKITAQSGVECTNNKNHLQ
jgi:hypothetical protein